MKYILVVHKSQKAEMLFRASDGIMVAMRQEAVVVYGDNPKDKSSYTFIDGEEAAKWLKDVYPKIDAKSEDSIELEIRDGEAHGLYVPDGSLEMPGMAPVRTAPLRRN